MREEKSDERLDRFGKASEEIITAMVKTFDKYNLGDVDQYKLMAYIFMNVAKSFARTIHVDFASLVMGLVRNELSREPEITEEEIEELRKEMAKLNS